MNVYADDEGSSAFYDVKLASFDVSFPSADIANKKVTLSVNAGIMTSEGIVYVDNRSTVLSVENIGYNTWIGKTAIGNIFAVTMLNDRLALITGYIGYTLDNWYDVDLIVFVRRVDAD